MAETAARASRTDFDPFSDAALRDPYPGYAMLRGLGPVVWLERYDAWCLPRHAEVMAVLQDWSTFCSGRGVGLTDFAKEPPWRLQSLILEADPPLHTRTRSVLSRVLSPAALKSMTTAFQAEATRLVDRALQLGDIDGVTDLAEAFPLKVFADAMGLPEAGREHLLTYGDIAFNAFGPRNGVLEAAMRGSETAVAAVLANCRREVLAPGGLGAQIFAAADAGEVTEHEAGLLVRSFLTAGVDTTASGLGWALHALADNPAQWARLRADPGLARNAFEEALRFASPVQTFFRTCTRDVELAGVSLREGDKVLMSLASANRDEDRWENADRFDIARKTGGHLAMGAGIHGCVGQMLARLEGETLLRELACRVETLELRGPPTHRINNTLRSLSALPLRVSAQQLA